MKTPLLVVALSCGLTTLDAGTPASSDAKKPAAPAATAKTLGGPILERSMLTSDWGGFRDDLATRGLTFDLNGVYTFQGVAGGGANFGDGSGNLFSGDLSMALDTGKAGLWPGGFLKFRLEARGGDGVLARVGSLSPVNNDLLLPNVPGALGDSAWAITELTYAQFLSEKFGVILGLVNTTSGDSNPIAGSIIANDHFLNTGFLYSAPEASVVPTVTLGGGLIFLPSKNLQGTFMVVGSTETAGYNPFEVYQGTTFTTEWTFKYTLGERPGGMTLGGLYSIDRSRTDLGADSRLFFGSALLRGQLLTTDSDAWAIYWNGYQYLQGDEENGWGLFGRLGFGDNNVNPIRFSMAAGVGGTSPLPGRESDRWGLGLYYIDMADLGVLRTLNLDHEIGAELFYNIALTPWAHLTFDAQVVNPAATRADTAVVLGTRLVIAF